LNAGTTLVVELIGVPGSGKTVATRAAIERLASRGIDCVGYDELEGYRTDRGDRYLNRCNVFIWLWHCLALYRRYPAIVLRVRWLALLHGALSRKRWRKARRPVTNLIMIGHLSDEFSGRVVIFDDGFLQKLWSMLVGARHLRGLAPIEALLAHYYAATGIRCIQLYIPDDLALARAFNRDSKGRFNRKADERTRAGFREWLGHHHAMTALMPPDAVVARIDGSAAPAEVAQAVADCVERIVREQRAGA
jgi:hypothetical protein